jgi:hypothetical protein
MYMLLHLFILISHFCASRTITEIKESENRARKQAEYLRTSLEENSLELRVRAANETETAYQRRLSIAEAELEELRTEVDASERLVICSWRQFDMCTTARSNW